MSRIKFKQGEQRKFLDLIVNRIGSVSLRGILQCGFDIKYSTLKSYYIERRLMSGEFFEDLCHLAKVSPKDFDIEYIDDNWGQVRGGKISKRGI